MAQSKFLGLTVSDSVKGIITAFLGASLLVIYNIITTGWPTSEQLLDALRAGLAAGFGYILKNLLSNSEGEFLKKEQ